MQPYEFKNSKKKKRKSYMNIIDDNITKTTARRKINDVNNSAAMEIYTKLSSKYHDAPMHDSSRR